MTTCKYFGLYNSYIEHTKPNLNNKIIIFLCWGKNCYSTSSFDSDKTNLNDHLINEYPISFLLKYKLINL
jgi:hypothetical protein